MRRPFTVLVYPIRRTSDGKSWEYLLLRRTAEREGFWQGVSGSLELGEDFEEAARRELFEETGFVPDELVQIDYSYAFPWRSGGSLNMGRM